jgi:hypothetical protein
VTFAGAILVAGCGGSVGNLPSIGGGLPSWFASADPASKRSSEPQVSVSEDCPSVDVRGGASTLVIAANVASPTANDVRYQLSFHELARQCFIEGGTLRMRVGVQGRAVVGPAGAPPQVSVPIRYAVVREGVQPKTVVTKFRRQAVSVPPGAPNVLFTDIEDDLSFPLPPLVELQAYVVYVGFDDMGDRCRR